MGKTEKYYLSLKAIHLPFKTTRPAGRLLAVQLQSEDTVAIQDNAPCGEVAGSTVAIRGYGCHSRQRALQGGCWQYSCNQRIRLPFKTTRPAGRLLAVQLQSEDTVAIQDNAPCREVAGSTVAIRGYGCHSRQRALQGGCWQYSCNQRIRLPFKTTRPAGRLLAVQLQSEDTVAIQDNAPCREVAGSTVAIRGYGCHSRQRALQGGCWQYSCNQRIRLPFKTTRPAGRLLAVQLQSEDTVVIQDNAPCREVAGSTVAIRGYGCHSRQRALQGGCWQYSCNQRIRLPFKTTRPAGRLLAVQLQSEDTVAIQDNAPCREVAGSTVAIRGYGCHSRQRALQGGCWQYSCNQRIRLPFKTTRPAGRLLAVQLQSEDTVAIQDNAPCREVAGSTVAIRGYGCTGWKT